jgi:carbonic anhydrase
MTENIPGGPREAATHCDRRRLLAALGTAAGFLTAPLVADEPQAREKFPKDMAEALARLKTGNARFADGKTRHAHESAEWRKHLIGEQKPFATVLGCSDSRVPPELVFDQGFGDLFIIRVAGNVIAGDVVASLAYAALHLGTHLFVVMGHTSCGAVTAALDAKLKKSKEPERIEALMKLIEPGLKDLDTSVAYPAVLAAAIEANVRWSVRQLEGMSGVKEAIRDGKIALAGAVYELDTGRVRFLTHDRPK